MPGRPDWQGYAQWEGAVLLDADVTVPVAGVTQSLGPVPNFRGLELVAASPAQDVRVDLRFKTSPGSANIERAARFEVRAGNTLQTIVPIMGTTVDLFAITDVQFDLGVLVRGSNRELLSPVYPHEQQLLMVVNETVGAGATSERFFGSPFSGWAWIWLWTNAGNYAFELHGEDYVGNKVQRVVRWVDKGQHNEALVIVPPYIMVARFTNNEAGPKEWYFGAIPLWG
jgi:hypothetical protein